MDISFNLGGASTERPDNFSAIFAVAGLNMDDEKAKQGIDGIRSFYEGSPVSGLWNVSLRLKTNEINADTFKSSSLTYNHSFDMEVIEANGAVKQVMTKFFLVDVTPLPAGQEGYFLKWYFANEQNAKVNNVYLPAGSVIKSVKISNPTPFTTYDIVDVSSFQDMDNMNFRRIHKRYVFGTNTAGNVTHTLETWTKDPADTSNPNNLPKKIAIDELEYLSGAPANGVVQNAQDRIRTLSVANLDATSTGTPEYGALTITSRLREVYSDVGGKRRMTKETKLSALTDDDTGLVTTFGYYDTPSNMLLHGRRRWMKRYDGFWTVWVQTAGSSSQTVKKITPFKDGAWVLDDDGANVASVVEAEARTETQSITANQIQTTVRILGNTFSRKFETFSVGSNGERIFRTWNRISAAGVLYQYRGYYPHGDGSSVDAGRLSWTISEDGTASTFSYADLGAGMTEVTKSTGAVDSISTTSAPVIVSGSRSVTTYNQFWEAVSVEKSEFHPDPANPTTEKVYQMESWAATEADHYGRATRMVYNANADDYQTVTYGCCGPVASRSRRGAVSTTAYDLLKRVFQRSRQDFPADSAITDTISRTGLVTTTTREAGSGASGISFVTSKTTKNLLGQTTETQTADRDGDGNLEVTTISTVYPGAGRVVTANGPLGTNRITSTYRDGQQKSLTGNAVAEMTYDYGFDAAQGGLWSKRIAANTTEWTQTFRGPLGRVTKTLYPDGAETAYQYFSGNSALGSRGKLLSQKDADEVANPGEGTFVSYLYNSEGERISTTTALPDSANGSAQSLVQSANSDVVDTVTIHGTTFGPAYRTTTEVNGTATTTSYRSFDGYYSGSTSLNGETLTSQSEPQAGGEGNWTAISLTPDGQQSVQTYIGGLLEKTEMFDNTNPGNLVASTSYHYDVLGRLQTSTDSRTGTVTYSGVTDTGYTPSGNLLGMKDAGNRLTKYSYDVLGRRIKVTLPDTSVTHTAYYLDGLVKAQWGSQSYPRWYNYDSQNRLRYLHTYTVDPNLDPTSLPANAPAGNAQTTEWVYHSSRGWLDQKKDAVNKGASYTYTDAGRLETRTWARGVVTNYGYEEGRLSAVTYSNETNGHTTPDLAYQYNGEGQLESVYRGSDLATLDPAELHAGYLYDNNFRLETETLNQDTNSKTLARHYDGSGRPKGLELGAEYAASYSYDDAGRLLHVDSSYPMPAQNPDFTYGYLASSGSLVDTVTGPAHTVTNVWENDRKVLLSKTNGDLATPISKFSYALAGSPTDGANSIGQREKLTTSGSAFANAAPVLDWGYNSQGELVSAADSSVAASSRGYKYDAIGNRLESVEGTTTLTNTNSYTPNNLNQYSAVPGVSSGLDYDDDGNATAYPMPQDANANAVLTWDAENRLVQVQMPNSGPTIAYDYDYLSRRISRSESSNITRWVYDGWNPIVEYAGTTIEKSYLWGMDLSGSMQGAGGVGGLLAVTDEAESGDPVYYPTYDGNGNVSEYLSGTGVVVAHYEYDPFGKEITPVAQKGSKHDDFAHRFSSKPIDSDTGLYYYGYRYYDPVTGRWPSRDPIEEGGGFNLYGFVGNDGVSYWDYLGREANGDSNGEDEIPKDSKENTGKCSEYSDRGNASYTLANFPASPSGKDPLGKVGKPAKLAKMGLNKILKKVMGRAAPGLPPSSSVLTVKINIVGIYKCCVCIKGTKKVKWSSPHLYNAEVGKGRPYSFPSEYDNALIDVGQGFLDAIEEIEGNCKDDGGS